MEETVSDAGGRQDGRWTI
jgi:hypothetical protein